MSATNRGGVRREGDFYATPPWAVSAIVHRLVDRAGLVTASPTIVDPFAGEGDLLQAARDTLTVCGPAALGVEPRFAGVELDADRAATARAKGFDIEHDDAFTVAPAWGDCVVLTNPPYSRAEDSVRACLRLAGRGGIVVMLLRLAFLEGKARAALHREHPSDVYVLARRPSFTGKGTDAAAYAWFVWGSGHGYGGKWEVLA